MGVALVGIAVGLERLGLLSRRGRPRIERRPVAPAAPGEAVRIWVQPTGRLEGPPPDRLVFHMTGPVTGEPDLELPVEQVRTCIRLDPTVPGRVVWTSGRTFEYRLEAPLEPGRSYRLTVACVPLRPDRSVTAITAQKFEIVPPAPAVLNGYVYRWDTATVTARLTANYPIQQVGVESFIAVEDAQGRSVAVRSVEPDPRPEAIRITFKNTGADVYRVVLRKGFPLARAGLQMPQDVAVEIRIPRKEVYVSSVRLREGSEGFALEVRCSVRGEAACRLDAQTVRSSIQLDPPVPYRFVVTSGGVDLFAEFFPEQTYRVRVRAGLATTDGAVLPEDQEFTVRVPQPAPRVRIAVRGRYLGRQGGVKLPVQVRQASQLRVSVYRLPPENLIPWYKALYAGEYGFRGLSEPVVRDRTVSVETSEKSPLTWLDLDRLMDTREPGLYEVVVELPRPPRAAAPSAEGEEDESSAEEDESYDEYDLYDESSPRRDSAYVVISDVALIAKTVPRRVYVWAVSAHAGQPLDGVDVRVLSDRNVVIGHCVTDRQGFCEAPYEDVRDRRPYLLIGRRGSDWTFLHLETSALSMEPFEVSGPDYWSINYVPYVYMERDLYRPGEEVHFAVVLRERGSFRGLALPVIVRVKDPRGRLFTELTGTTDAAGMKAFAFPTPPNALTGRYALELWVGERLATTGYVFVETFVPERMTVRLTPDKPRFGADEAPSFRVQADYLFGAPAAGETYKGTCNFTEAPFRSPDFPDYSFGYVRGPEEEAPTAQVEVEGRLDEKGATVVTCRPPDLQRFLNPVRLTLQLDVFEAGSGRSTKGRAETTIYRFPLWIGLKPVSRRVLPNRPVQVQGVVLDLDGRPVAGETRLTYEIYLVSRDYVRVYDPQGGFRWQWTRQEVPMTGATPVVARDGRFQVQFTPTDYWYDYVVQVQAPDTGATARVWLTGWGWWGEAERPDSPEILRIRLDKPEADYGTTVEAQALLPFEGRILWTLETDTVVQSEWQDAQGTTASWKFRVPTGVPTIYVSALLFRTGPNYVVTRAFGVQRLPVRPTRHRLNLSVEAPDHVRPGTDLKVRIQGDRPFQATVAIVDEGILQITRFATPDAYGAVFAPWAAVVRTAETLGWVIQKVAQATGGGERPVLAPTPTFTRLVSYWSGLVRSDDRGRLEVTFSVPPYQGRLRVMVVAAEVERLGGAEKSVRVSSDIVVLPTLPRFVHAGDTFRFPVRLTNTTTRPATVRLDVEVDGAEFSDRPPQTVELPPQGTHTVWVPLRVTRPMGTLEVRIQATGLGDRYADTFRLDVRPDRPYERHVTYVAVPPGETDLRPYVRDWLPSMQKTRILLSPLAGLSSLMHWKYLVGYPYGCVEQTASSLLPLLRLPSIVEFLDPDFARSVNWTDRVRSGIGRLIAMQTPSGGFAFWPGGTEPDPWASIYATFVLLVARQAGYPVPTSTLEDALRYIEGHARARPFGYYVLALGRRLQGSDLDRIAQLLDQKLSFEDRLFLIGALYHGGRTATAEQALQTVLRQQPEAGHRLSGDFYSPLRALGVQLYILETLHPGAPEHEGLVRTLVERLRKPSGFYSTQELAWAILALELRLRHVRSATPPEADLRADGRSVRAVSTPQGLAWTVERAADLETLVIRHSGPGDLYLTIETEGFPAKPTMSAESAGLSVERRYLTLEGRPVQNFHLRDLVVVELAVTPTQNVVLDNVAVEDRLPAGLEIQNPRLGEGPLLTWIDRNRRWTPEYVDVRDDRIVVFGRLPGAGTRSYYYLVRVVTPGEFFQPAASAQAMYRPEIRGQTDVGRLTVGEAPGRVE
jgi:uncharacterized protein YfaS (alpha-2-macroglobulin family)